jgi:hypothetical protein
MTLKSLTILGRSWGPLHVNRCPISPMLGGTMTLPHFQQSRWVSWAVIHLNYQPSFYCSVTIMNNWERRSGGGWCYVATAFWRAQPQHVRLLKGQKGNWVRSLMLSVTFIWWTDPKKIDPVNVLANVSLAHINKSELLTHRPQRSARTY